MSVSKELIIMRGETVHEGIIEKLYQEYTVHGFISEDYIFDVLEENGISLFDVEYIATIFCRKVLLFVMRP